MSTPLQDFRDKISSIMGNNTFGKGGKLFYQLKTTQDCDPTNGCSIKVEPEPVIDEPE